MDSEIKSQITSILQNNNLTNQYSEMLDSLDLSPIALVLDAMQKKNAHQLGEALTLYSKCSVENSIRNEQHERLGHLARQFQKSLISFRDSLGPTIASLTKDSGNVQTQIESVIAMTNDSAMTVLNLADKQSKAFKAFKNEAEEISSALVINGSDEGIKTSFEQLSVKMQEINSDLEESNKHLMLSQTYQDLTGQILQKIKYFIVSVEDGLMEIVRMLAEDNIDHKLAEIDRDRMQNNCSQDDVDDLLSSLGF